MPNTDFAITFSERNDPALATWYQESKHTAEHSVFTWQKCWGSHYIYVIQVLIPYP